MPKFKIFEGSGIRDIYEQVATADGNGTEWKKVGQEHYTFAVEIGEDDLRSMGGRAARNQSGKAVRGGLQAKIISRKRVHRFLSYNGQNLIVIFETPLFPAKAL